MTLSTIDKAFVDRWRARQTTTALIDRTPPATPSEVAPSLQAPPEPPAPIATASVAPITVTAAPTGVSIVERLLVAGCNQWESLADEVEAARAEGHRVIAVAGGEQGEGRTTLIGCLAHTLKSRGRDVVVLDDGEHATEMAQQPSDGGRLHDRRIILVDAGIWFPPGPIRRERVGHASVGCDAAILVRRANREPIHARATALAAVGVSVLGEVVTFAPNPGDS